jgi:ribose 5-phosphate isomerase B
MLKENVHLSVYVGFDHGGQELGHEIMDLLSIKGYLVFCPQLEFFSDHAVIPYPAVVPGVVSGILEKTSWGVLVCGSGIGMSIAANRYAGVRAALCRSPQEAVLGRQHNNANILVLGARITDVETALACVEAFHTTPFEGGRHAERTHMLDHLPALPKQNAHDV